MIVNILVIGMMEIFSNVSTDIVAESIDSPVVIAFEKFLDGLVKSDRESILKAIDCYHLKSKHMSPNEKDKCFVLFRDYYTSAIDSINLHLFNLRDMHAVSNGSKGSYVSINDGSWSQYGMDVLEEEAYEYLAESNSFLLDNFQTFVTDSIIKFMLLRAKEETQIFQRDAAIIISWKELAIRCLNWENYLKEYPNSFLIEDAKEFDKIYLSAFLSGTNNTRVFDREERWLDQKCVEEISKTFTWVIKNYPSSKLSSLLRDYLPILEKSNFLESSSIFEFLSRNGISPYYASRKLDR